MKTQTSIGNIKVYITADYKAMSQKAARIMQGQIMLKPNSVLGLATGSTPICLYDCLAEWHKAGELDFSAIRSVNLDEYQGLSGDSDQSYRFFMNKNLFSRVNIDVKKTYVPDGLAPDAATECARYDALIESLGGVDMQLLGLGRNGHIGFNEPAETFSVGTQRTALTESTIDANKRFFASEKDVPRFAFSMGIGTIMKARKILLAASGKDKAEAVRGMIAGGVTPKLPASILQFHPDVSVVLDTDAASLL
ncbi:MAG: glucosamine-6-phosphate deaminase [Treponemataceae bacterium]|nr:MAG: glucosamine-6-phosphate deaminase [Treponemataceae bacterium]